MKKEKRSGLGKFACVRACSGRTCDSEQHIAHKRTQSNIEISLSNVFSITSLDGDDKRWKLSRNMPWLSYAPPARIFQSQASIMHKIYVYHACFTVVSVSYFSNVFVFDVVVSPFGLHRINYLRCIRLVAKKNCFRFLKKRVNIGWE